MFGSGIFGSMGGMGGGRRGGMSMFTGMDEDDNMEGISFTSSGGMPGGMPGGMHRSRPAGMPRSASRRNGTSSEAPEKPNEITRPLKLSLAELYTGSVKRLKVGRRLMDGTTEDKVLEIQILPGWKSGTKIRFPHAGNEGPHGGAQDLVFMVEEKPHNAYTREGNDLVCRLKIPLVEALTGGTGTGKLMKELELLDGRKKQIAVPMGIVKPGQETIIPDEGMPIRKEGSVKQKGDLIIKWDVVFPDRLTSAQKETIRRTLTQI